MIFAAGERFYERAAALRRLRASSATPLAVFGELEAGS
jgi:hypothetical protein